MNPPAIKRNQPPARPGKKVSRGKPGCLSRLFFLLMVGVALAATAFIFFNVRLRTVTGESHYTEEEILSSIPVQVGDNLIFFNKYEVIRDLSAKLPYLKQIQIDRELPGTLRVEVEEYRAIAGISSGTDTWLLSTDGKLLEQVSGPLPDGLMEIRGISLQSPQVGAQARVESEGTLVFDSMTDLLEAIQKAGISEAVSSVNLAKIYVLEFQYMDRFQVKLGMPEDLDHKLNVLKGVVDGLEINEQGVIDLTELMVKEIARFIPKSE